MWNWAVELRWPRWIRKHSADMSLDKCYVSQNSHLSLHVTVSVCKKKFKVTQVIERLCERSLDRTPQRLIWFRHARCQFMTGPCQWPGSMHILVLQGRSLLGLNPQAYFLDLTWARSPFVPIHIPCRICAIRPSIPSVTSTTHIIWEMIIWIHSSPLKPAHPSISIPTLKSIKRPFKRMN